jgi:pre-mRNA-splicing factor RBM22/SLT11
VRDAALGIDEAMPTSDVNREYYTQNQEAALESAGGLTAVGQLGKAASSGYSKGHELLKKMARTKPYYRRNLPQICSFYVKGECSRGEECPYRHELPKDPNGPLAKQNMKDRYYGVNDPVAEKMMSKSADKQKRLEPPEDKSVMNLFIVGVEEPFVSQANIRDHFYQYGEIHKVNVLKKSKAALVHYTTREAAEKVGCRRPMFALNPVVVAHPFRDVTGGALVCSYHLIPPTSTPTPQSEQKLNIAECVLCGWRS